MCVLVVCFPILQIQYVCRTRVKSMKWDFSQMFNIRFTRVEINWPIQILLTQCMCKHFRKNNNYKIHRFIDVWRCSIWSFNFKHSLKINQKTFLAFKIPNSNITRITSVLTMLNNVIYKNIISTSILKNKSRKWSWVENSFDSHCQNNRIEKLYELAVAILTIFLIMILKLLRH